MNFAVLGDDSSILPLIEAVSSQAQHRLTHATDVDAILPELLDAAPGVRVSDGWEHLLLAADVDAVIASGSSAAVHEGVKQLSAAGKPIVFFPAVEQGLAFIYELGMIWDESRPVLFPVLPLRDHPSVAAALELITAGSLGPILHLHLERELHLKKPSDARVLPSGPNVDDMLLPDIDLLRMLGGNYSQVTALRSGSEAEGISRATVNLTGEGLPEASWSLNSTASESGWKLTVTGQSGSLVLQSGQDPHGILLETELEGAPPANVEDFAPSEILLSRFELAASGESFVRDWTDLTRAFEILDAAHRSVKRRRTIDLFFETTSERSIFKTQMTALGCGLMSFTLFAVLLLLFVAALADPRGAREAQSEAAGFIFYVEEFVDGSAELNADGKLHVSRIVGPFGRTRTWLLVEQGGAAVAELDEQRRDSVVEEVEASGADDADLRTQVAKLRGKWFLPAMRVARFAVFAPLFLYLALQLLLFVARPASTKTTTPDSPGQTPQEAGVIEESPSLRTKR